MDLPVDDGTIRRKEREAMYAILTDALLRPRALIQYRNKPSWFVLLYLSLLALLATIGTAIGYLTYAADQDFDATAAGCAYVDGSLVCDDPDRDYREPLAFFGAEAYFLPSGTDVAELDLLTGVAFVFQDEYVAMFADGEAMATADLGWVLANGASLDEVMAGFERGVMTVGILTAFLGNLVLLAAFALMSAASLVRLRGFLPFGKAFTVLAFSAFPFALVLTFQSLLGLPDWAMILLMIVSFRSSFLVIRELYEQAYAYLQPESAKSEEEEDRDEDDEERPADEPDDESGDDRDE